MTEVIGDVVQPSDFIVPRKDYTVLSGVGLISGELVLSGDKLWFGDSAGFAVLVTSA